MALSRSVSSNRSRSPAGDDQSFFLRTPRPRSGFGLEIPILPHTLRPSRESHHAESAKDNDRSTVSRDSHRRRGRNREPPKPPKPTIAPSHRQVGASIRRASHIRNEPALEEPVSVVQKRDDRSRNEDSSSVTYSNTGEGEFQSRRTESIDQAVDEVYESINNKMLVPERLDWFLNSIEQRSDDQICKTYGNGIYYEPFTESAPAVTVGLSFVPGVSGPQVARGEQDQMTTLEPDQKSAEWRHNTAASLLRDVVVTPQLEVRIIDQTAEIIARLAAPSHNSSFFGGASSALQKASKGDTNLINIDSQNVVVVDDLRRGTWDLKSTLIEVDGSSLIRLTVNYKHLISRGGPDMTFDEMRVLLEMMIEDARRLCLRSPNLFRMSTRRYIMRSENTRYGVDHGTIFKTLTTSKGIREVLSLSASYYNSLDPNGTEDPTQMFIRPRFLQMVVLLLSLLNDQDLAQIAPFLQATYGIRADRKHVEIMFLKVLPLISINSEVFLKAMIYTFEDWGSSESNDRAAIAPPNLAAYWDAFIQRVHAYGYLLPAVPKQLGRDPLSWVKLWDGYKNTECFKDLQYCGSGSGLTTMNDIERVQLRPEAALEEVSVILTNGRQYIIKSKDLQEISCLMYGKYPLSHPRRRSGDLELVIEEQFVDEQLWAAKQKVDDITSRINRFVNTVSRRTSFLNPFGRSQSRLGILETFQLSGRVTRHEVILERHILAIGYKINGRRITRKDAVRHLTNDFNAVTACVRHIERYAREIDIKPSSTERKDLQRALNDVNFCLSNADQDRRAIRLETEFSSEPIKRTLYPNIVDSTGKTIWYDHRVRYIKDQGLGIEGKHSQVLEVHWLPNQVAETRLSTVETKLWLQPLIPFPAGKENGQICKGDCLTLAGRFAIISKPVSVDTVSHSALPDDREFVDNYMRIVGVDTTNTFERGDNRRRQATQEWEKVYK